MQQAIQQEGRRIEGFNAKEASEAHHVPFDESSPLWIPYRYLIKDQDIHKEAPQEDIFDDPFEEDQYWETFSQEEETSMFARAYQKRPSLAGVLVIAVIVLAALSWMVTSVAGATEYTTTDAHEQETAQKQETYTQSNEPAVQDTPAPKTAEGEIPTTASYEGVQEGKPHSDAVESVRESTPEEIEKARAAGLL